MTINDIEFRPFLIEDQFLKHKRSGNTSSREWIFDRHEIDLERFISETFHPGDHEEVIQLFYDEPLVAKLWLTDYLRTNKEKIAEVIRNFRGNKSTISLILGKRGGGKTATGFWLAEILKDERKIYYAGEEVKALPDWVNVVSSIDEAPRGSFILMDEAGIQASSRNFFDKNNLILSKQLMTARHDDKSVAFMTQNSALADKNITRLADAVFMKPASTFQMVTERKLESNKVVRQLVYNLMPRKKSETLFMMGNRILKFTQPLPEMWNNDVSQSWKNIGQKLKEEDRVRTIERVQREELEFQRAKELATIRGSKKKKATQKKTEKTDSWF